MILGLGLGLTRQRRIPSGPIDPLAGITFAARLQATDLKPAAPRPQVFTVDFTGQTGANYVTAGDGHYLNVYSNNSASVRVAPWFNTGTENAPAIPGPLVEVDISPTAIASDIATALAAASVGFPLWTLVAAGAVVTFTSVATVTYSAAVDVNTGAVVTLIQPGGQYARTLGLFTDAGNTVPVVNWGDKDYHWKSAYTDAAQAEQSISTQRPVTQYAKNGSGLWLPNVTFDGVDDNMLIGPIALAGDFSLFFAQRSSGDCGLAGNNNATTQFIIGEAASNVLSSYDNTNNPSSSVLGVPQGSWSVIGFIRTGSVIEFWQNNISYGTGACVGSLIINSISGISGRIFTGNLTAMLVSQTAVSSSDRAKIFTYLATLLPA